MRINKKTIEQKANIFRLKVGLNTTEAIDVKTIVRKNNILTVYLPMSEKACGLSLLSPENDRFILVNSNTPKGRQHFTIAHELYHLYYDESPQPHICMKDGRSVTERTADSFAAALLMPTEGIVSMMPERVLERGNVPLSVVLRLEQYFRVSRSAMLYRLRELGFLSEEVFQGFIKMSPLQTAIEYGYDTTLYKPGNNFLTIGDYGEKARILYERTLFRKDTMKNY